MNVPSRVTDFISQLIVEYGGEQEQSPSSETIRELKQRIISHGIEFVQVAIYALNREFGNVLLQFPKKASISYQYQAKYISDDGSEMVIDEYKHRNSAPIDQPELEYLTEIFKDAGIASRYRIYWDGVDRIDFGFMHNDDRYEITYNSFEAMLQKICEQA